MGCAMPAARRGELLSGALTRRFAKDADQRRAGGMIFRKVTCMVGRVFVQDGEGIGEGQIEAENGRPVNQWSQYSQREVYGRGRIGSW
jgi:hypothetical protein